MKPSPAWLWLAAVAFRTPCLAAQEASVLVRLAPANAVFAEEFSRLTAIRELSDGRVLVTDRRDKRLVVADFRNGTITQIGSVGGGPGEYETAGLLIGLPGDSTLLIAGDRGARWLVLSGIQIVATVPSDDPVMQLVGHALLGADHQGRLLSFQSMPEVRLAPGWSRAMAAVVVIDRIHVRADTIERLRGAETQMRVGGTRERPLRAVYQVVYSAPDQAVMFPDGWIAVVHQEPYRVDWRSPSGTTLSGPSLSWTSAPVNDAEKQGYLSRLQRRLGPRATLPPEMPWADRTPPFPDDALFAGSNGMLCVLRTQWSGAPDTMYDLIDRRGERTGSLVMPWNQRIVGFGRNAVYLAVADDDGVERLQRHPWPR